MTRKLHLNLFLMPRGHHEAAWRHPASAQKALTDVDLYAKAAQIAEAAKFDAVFLADALVAPNNGGLVATGALEPLTLLSALAMRTEKIGLIGTASTTTASLTRWHGSSPRSTISRTVGPAGTSSPPGRRRPA